MGTSGYCPSFNGYALALAMFNYSDESDRPCMNLTIWTVNLRPHYSDSAWATILRDPGLNELASHASKLFWRLFRSQESAY